MTRHHDTRPLPPVATVADVLFAVILGLLAAALLAHWICQ